MPVIRNFKVFFVKNIVVIVVIVQAAMLSLVPHVTKRTQSRQGIGAGSGTHNVGVA